MNIFPLIEDKRASAWKRKLSQAAKKRWAKWKRDGRVIARGKVTR